jgi:hypothetical protein
VKTVHCRAALQQRTLHVLCFPVTAPCPLGEDTALLVCEYALSLDCRSFFASPGAEVQNDFQSGTNAGANNFTTCGRRVISPSDVASTPALEIYAPGDATIGYFYWRLWQVDGLLPPIQMRFDSVLSNGSLARALCRTAPTEQNPQPCNNMWCGYTNVLRTRTPAVYTLAADSSDTPFGVAYAPTGYVTVSVFELSMHQSVQASYGMHPCHGHSADVNMLSRDDQGVFGFRIP